MLRPFWAFGTWPLATYFTATGDNLHATAALKLNDSPVAGKLLEVREHHLSTSETQQCLFSLNNNLISAM